MNTTMRTALEVAHYAMLKFAPEECEREIKTAKAALDENPVPAKWIERNAAVYQKGVNDGLALADKGRQKSEAMTGPFTAEVNSWRRWEIYSRSQHLCHCDTEEKRDILIKALNFWQSGADLAEDNARLERIVKDLNDANRVLMSSTVAPRKECEECEGTGQCSFYECDELVDCVECAGTGTVANSESQGIADEKADEKPDGQAENASRVGPPTNTSTNKTDV